jgi:acetyl esterase/lipase
MGEKAAMSGSKVNQSDGAESLNPITNTEPEQREDQTKRTNSKRAPLPPPTFANVGYGPHEKHVFDFWLADSEEPTPLVLYIHGGGFTGGSKEGLKSSDLEPLLKAGISVASVEYRLIKDRPLPAAHFDARRAIQFIRSKAGEWNFDKDRIGAFGGSAGAQLCMWLAFHEEMADPNSDDPLKRESTRLACVASKAGQATMDRDWWLKNIPGYSVPHRDQRTIFGVQTEEELKPLVEEVSVINHLTADDPPIFMIYGQHPDDPVPDDADKARSWQIHHVVFGLVLKEKMDALGIEAVLNYPGAETIYKSEVDFLIGKLLTDGAGIRGDPARDVSGQR